MAKRRRRRNWSDDEKRMICAQTRVSGVSVSQVARRYDVNANQVFNWLKDPRFASNELDEDAACFLPVEVLGQAQQEAPRPVVAESRIEVEIVCGHRMSITGSYDPKAVASLIRGLSG